MRLEFQGITSSGDQTYDTDIRDLEVVQTEGGAYLVAINGVNGGLSVYDMSANSLNLEDAHLHDIATLLTGDAVVPEGSDDLLLGGTLDSERHSYEVDAAGQISSISTLTLPNDAQTGLRHLDQIELSSGNNALFAIDGNGDLRGWRLGDTEPAALEVTGGEGFSGLAQIQAMEVAGAPVVIVADGANGTVTSYRVNPLTGATEQVDSMGPSQGLSMARPTALAEFQAYGQSWVAVGSAGSDTITILNVNDGGALGFADQISDTLLSRFQDVTAIEPIAIGDQTFLAAAGSDDGITILTLMPDGQLVHVTTLEHQLGAGLENINALELYAEGGVLHVFASSSTTEGIAQYTVPLSDFGSTDVATGASDHLTTGVSGATLNGGAGDDILHSTQAGDVLTGGSGADRFVIQAVDGEVTITDFTAGVDRLDLSLLPGLRNLGQLGFSTSATGALITYQDTIIRLNAGAPLSIADIWPDGLQEVDHHTLGDVSEGDVRYGSATADLMTGTGEVDQIDGQTGNDTIDGQGGADLLMGGDGLDVLRGGLGQDSLYGGLGDDVLQGGVDADELFGEMGDDRLFGEDDADLLWGASGQDFLHGGRGDDQLSGGWGQDTLKGGLAQDVLLGGEGADMLKGNGGNDSLFGNAGADTLKGGRGDDRLEGGAGNDTLKGKLGDDMHFGEEGNDLLKGGEGQDSLWGGSGDDRLDGGQGSDLYNGGAGADRFMFKRFHGVDRIDDFTSGEDIMDLRFLGEGGIKRFQGLTITQDGEDVRIQTGLGEIWLSGTDMSTIDGGDFLF